MTRYLTRNNLSEGEFILAYSFGGYSPSQWGKKMVVGGGGVVLHINVQSGGREQIESEPES